MPLEEELKKEWEAEPNFPFLTITDIYNEKNIPRKFIAICWVQLSEKA
jgi:hypothetical protein